VDAATRETRTSTARRYFEKPLLVAAVLSIPTTILQFTQVSEPLHMLGETLNWIIWLAFLAELVTMLALAPDRARYLLVNPIDLAIVVLTPPFIGGAVQSIRALRLLRVFRLLRLAPLARIVFSFEGVKATAGLALLTAMVGGAGFAAEEGISFGNGLYWAIATMTTVGGNLTPKTTEGKIISVVVMLVGIGTATLLIGAVAQRFLAPDVEHVEATEDDLLAQVRHISTQLGKLERTLRERTHAVSDGQTPRVLPERR
jgi:voltage-gated potassium channel